MVDSTAAYQKENYLDAGWDAFLAARKAAEKVLADESASQKDVDQAKGDLAKAMTGLRYKADKSLLKEVIAKARAIDLTGYSQESAACLQSALAKAEEIMENDKLSVYEQPLVDAAAQDLQNAIAGLNKKPEKSADPSKPGGDKGSKKDNRPGTNGKNPAANKSGAGQKRSGGKNVKSAKTGDLAPIGPAAAGMVLAVAGIAVLLWRRKRQ